MKSLYRIVDTPSPCGYLPGRSWRMEYVHVAEMTPQEYSAYLLKGWRRFGRQLFRPRCQRCRECRSLRIPVGEFSPDRSQRRNARRNRGEVRLDIGPPQVDPERLVLYGRFHAHQAATKGWPERVEDASSYSQAFLSNPIPTEEWRFLIGHRLVGVGYVDRLPVGLSAIYFVHEPDEHGRGLGTWNVLSLINAARDAGLPHVYLGYLVPGCPSLAYKARFRPCEALTDEGQWLPHDPEP